MIMPKFNFLLNNLVMNCLQVRVIKYWFNVLRILSETSGINSGH